MVVLGNVVDAMERLYDPATAESWDAVGLVCGDRRADVRRVLFAVDPVLAVVDEALAWGADLVISHHPLLLTGVHSVAAGTPKGQVVHRLISGGCALLVAHTNADHADPGVSDALADVLGIRDLRPLVPSPPDAYDKVVVFVPTSDAEAVTDALAAAGAGALGAYTRCAWSTSGTGTFVPGTDATPAIGEVGARAQVDETRLEMLVPRARRHEIIAALRASHPYEEPAFDVYEVASPRASTRGVGRVGQLEAPVPLHAFAATVAASLPATAVGVRVAGDPDAVVRTVAVCGGSGGSYIDAARGAEADVYVTADLRHHPTSEAIERAAVEGRAMSLIDVPHWASEWPWLPVAAKRLANELGDDGTGAATVETRVSRFVTDPWTLTVPSPAGPSD